MLSSLARVLLSNPAVIIRNSSFQHQARSFAANQRRNTSERRKAKRAAGTKRFGNYNYQRPTIERWEILKGDLVEVMTGEFKGKQAKVFRVDRQNETCFLSELNRKNVYIHEVSVVHKPRIVNIHQPFAYRDLKLVDPKLKVATSVRWEMTEDAGRTKYNRISEASGEIIPFPKLKVFHAYKRIGNLETSRQSALEITYEKHALFGLDWTQRAAILRQQKADKEKQSQIDREERKRREEEQRRLDEEVAAYLNKMTPQERAEYEKSLARQYLKRSPLE